MSSQFTLQLDTLPGEVIDGICDHLNKKELKALRLSTKRISAIATTHLAKEYMFNLCSLMTRRSLEKLAEICAHPQFGPHVRKVHLSSGRVHPREMRALIERVEDMQRRIPPPTSAQVKRAKAKMQDAMNRSSKEYELEVSGDAVSILSRAFAALRTYQTPIILDISDFEVPRYNHFHGEPELCFKSTMEPCLEAIFRTKMQFAELELTVDALSIDPEERGYDTHTMRSEGLELLASLKSVALDFNNTFDAAGTKSTAHILSYANALENFTYRQGCDDLNRDDWFSPQQQLKLLTNNQFAVSDAILESVKSAKLTALWIEYAPLSYDTIVQVMEMHADTLTSIRIAHTCLRDGNWSDLFSNIKKNCRFLTQLDIENLSQARPDRKEGDYRPLILPEEWNLGLSGSRAEVEETLEKLVNAPSLEVLELEDRRMRIQMNDVGMADDDDDLDPDAGSSDLDL
ncbi:hypothetical protein E4T38_00522 [Aureobasidium subglaciale]|nr:hypothetical protein E4T38_00522 [Aureobasidium subglaciale]KAI5231612.1 hypothetical protein E4T40_00381 [Aureobasidium subglaciale]KAI5234400.1 hypothetical protein E4T41_00521 [Aureobasidium subglaciale]KAI5268051.1 hypothetical protein E4T46_00521 [Aureobasidium subglaciale]